jgi:hypothetical protein
MKSEITGNATSGAEVLNVSPHGFWLLVQEREFFLDSDLFPWFRQATLDQLFAVELHHRDHLHWPRLEVDLDLDRIEHPERYPLVAKLEKWLMSSTRRSDRRPQLGKASSRRSR